MAKNIRYALYVLLFLCSLSPCFSQTCIERTYLSQVGVRERTGHNDGPAVELYLRGCGLGPGYAWCAAFVRWCYLQCGVDCRRITAWAASTINYDHIVYAHATVPAPMGKIKEGFSTEPRAGDNVTFWDYVHRRVAHTGLYHRRLNETFYESVEGNTNEGGSAEGDGVYRKKRSFHTTYIISRWIN